MDLTCKRSSACYTKDQTLEGDFYVLSTNFVSTPQYKDSYEGIEKNIYQLKYLIQSVYSVVP